VTEPGRELDPAGCPRLADSGVYLLGALTSPERADYAAHLNGCTHCQSEVDQLAHLPALLNRITAPAPPTGPGVTSPASATTTGRPTGRRTRSRQRTGPPARPAPADTGGQSTRPGRRGPGPV
jgi:anti-sigma factor RsiW